MANYPFQTPAFNKPSRPVPKYAQPSTPIEPGLLTTPKKRPSSEQVRSRTRLKLNPPSSTDIPGTPNVIIRTRKIGQCPDRKRENIRSRKRISPEPPLVPVATVRTPAKLPKKNSDDELASRITNDSASTPIVVKSAGKDEEETSGQKKYNDDLENKDEAPNTSEDPDDSAMSIINDRNGLLNKGESDRMTETSTINGGLPEQGNVLPPQTVQSIIKTKLNGANHNVTAQIQEADRLLQGLEDTTVISTPLSKKAKKKQKAAVQKSEKKEQTDGKYSCDECGRTASSRQCVERHIEAKHLKVKNFICEQCGEGFGYAITLKYHRFHAHREGDREVVCDNCDRLFDPFVMMTHIHHLRNCGHQKLHCTECDEVRKNHPYTKKAPYFSYSQLLHHKQIAHKPKKCQKCDITFEHQFEYLQHLQKYHNLTLMEGAFNRPAEERMRTLICDGCDKTRSFHPVKEKTPMRRFQRHMIRCTTKAFDCKCCKAYYRRKEDRDQHVLEEHPDRYGRFICDICAHTTHAMDHLRSHIKDMHPNESGTRTEVICDTCNSVHNKLYFVKHLKAVHYKLPPTTYTCDNCPMTCCKKFSLADVVVLDDYTAVDFELIMSESQESGLLVEIYADGDENAAAATSSDNVAAEECVNSTCKRRGRGRTDPMWSIPLLASMEKYCNRITNASAENLEAIYLIASFLDPSTAAILDDCRLITAKGYVAKLLAEKEAGIGDVDVQSGVETVASAATSAFPRLAAAAVRCSLPPVSSELGRHRFSNTVMKLTPGR